MVTGFYYSFCSAVAIIICAAVIVHDKMAVNTNRVVSVDANVSQSAVARKQEAIAVQPYFLTRFHHAIQIADVEKTLFSREDFSRVQQPVAVKQRIDEDRTDGSLRRFLRFSSDFENMCGKGMNIIEQDVNKREIYRYLGYGKAVPDESVRNLVEEVLHQMLIQLKPRVVWQTYDSRIRGNDIFLKRAVVDWEQDAETCEFTEADADVILNSEHLAQNLKSCHKVILFAATIGIEADKLLHRYEITNMAKASVAQACGAACIEAYCNKLQREFEQKAAERGLALRPRFSPGYGDLPLETQKHIFEMLDCAKRLGLTLTDNMLMYPTKSVTAFIGLTTNREDCHVGKCSQCENVGCEFRDED